MQYLLFTGIDAFLGNIGVPQHGKYLFLLYQQTRHQPGDLLMLLHSERISGECHSKVPFMTV